MMNPDFQHSIEECCSTGNYLLHENADRHAVFERPAFCNHKLIPWPMLLPARSFA
jgi:hypothetical protein